MHPERDDRERKFGDDVISFNEHAKKKKTKNVRRLEEGEIKLERRAYTEPQKCGIEFNVSLPPLLHILWEHFSNSEKNNYSRDERIRTTVVRTENLKR